MGELLASRPERPGSGDWRAALAMALSAPDHPTLVFQPIVDIVNGTVVGYEALSRFELEPAATPDVWFRQARLYGGAARLEARVVARAVAARELLPEPRFLTVNISPDALASEPVQQVLREAGKLTGFVVELTGHAGHTVGPQLSEAIRSLRAAGALLAMDDAGSGYAGLVQLLDVRPDIVKIDRELITGVGTDRAKAWTVELLGSLAGRLDAYVLAEGIETQEELERCQALGVPLAQGWLLGRPAPAWSELPAEVAARIVSSSARAADTGRIGSLAVRTAPLRPGELLEPSPSPRVRVDRDGCPDALYLPLRRASDPQGYRGSDAILRVNALTPLADAALRAMARPAERRFDPLVCVDDTGRYVGVVLLDAVVTALSTARP
ncbi:EAL domain-containing protein [Motilibacter aurantiacus]|uniref:EAL domain-containing protein n=1 Tax=Motilibacter aurantiacus TaxID=2714955 RepID=UPI00140ABDD0|nr:EAL domain-containing protein [Motilibacter aurantiacus]NHC46261.1 EAL domain-containing protein [Motilibacter aurantiacus]